MLKVLLLGRAGTQQEIARLAGVSQPRVSQILHELVSQGIIEHKPKRTRQSDSWRVQDWDALASHWLSQYPGPGGLATFWYGVDSLRDQVAHAVALLTSSGDGQKAAEVLVSGDIAVDRLAPWARPQRGVIYAKKGEDLSTAGLTPSPAEHATVELVVPEDPGVWTLVMDVWQGHEASPPVNDAVFADPLQILWDLQRTSSPDADQASEHFKAWIHDRFGPQSPDGPDNADGLGG